jgi:acyl-CoA thioesterase-1
MGTRLSWQTFLIRTLAVCLLTAMFGAFGAAYAKSVLIVAIGADNVHGRGIGHRRTGGVPVGEAFPAQLQALLRARGIDADVINAGVGGDTSAGMLARLGTAIPAGTQLVILDRANGNDKRAGLKARQNDYIRQINARLRSRHIALIILPSWGKIPGALANRASDGHHFTAKGHAAIARYLLPEVMARLGR